MQKNKETGLTMEKITDSFDENLEYAAMVELKRNLKLDARRHSNKLVGKIRAVLPDFPEIAEDAIHQEVLYATMDGYRTTMQNITRNGENNAQDEQDTIGNR
jgi:hypothetical protein